MAGPRAGYNRAMRDGLRPGGRLRGELRVPGSKSLAQRALVAAALARGTTRLRGAPENDDVVACARALAACGVDVERTAPGAWRVVGRPPGSGGGWHARGPVEAGESGTGTRLVVAALAFAGRPGETVEIAPRGTLRQRSSAPLLAALARAGVGIEPGPSAGGWPLHLAPHTPPEALHLEHPLSSQELSALLLAAAAFPAEVRVHVAGPVPSRTYLALTEAVLRAFGGSVERLAGELEAYAVRGPLSAPAQPFEVEPDASSAAVALTAACVTDGELWVPGLGPDSPQGDVAVVEALAAFGCRAGAGPRGLHAAGRPTHGATLDLGPRPDLAPPLAALAMAVALQDLGASTLTGLGALARKESPRCEVLAGAARALGLGVATEGDALTIRPAPGATPEGPVTLDARGDHRMAFAFALVGLAREGVRVEGAECVAKSWPAFWRDLERAGARRAAPEAV